MSIIKDLGTANMVYSRELNICWDIVKLCPSERFIRKLKISILNFISQPKGHYFKLGHYAKGLIF